jgi:hypothetical protein
MLDLQQTLSGQMLVHRLKTLHQDCALDRKDRSHEQMAFEQARTQLSPRQGTPNDGPRYRHMPPLKPTKSAMSQHYSCSNNTVALYRCSLATNPTQMHAGQHRLGCIGLACSPR